jgi:hypothetical protein
MKMSFNSSSTIQIVIITVTDAYEITVTDAYEFSPCSVTRVAMAYPAA